MERGPRRNRPGGNDEIPALRHPLHVGMENLPEPTPDLIPDNRVAHLLGHGKPEAGGSKLVRKSVRGEQLASISRPPTINSVELGRVGDPRIAASWQSSHSETLAATPTPSSDDPAPADRAHSLAKPMGFRPLAAIRLVSSLHFGSSGRMSDPLNSKRVYPSHQQPSSANRTIPEDER